MKITKSVVRKEVRIVAFSSHQIWPKLVSSDEIWRSTLFYFRTKETQRDHVTPKFRIRTTLALGLTFSFSSERIFSKIYTLGEPIKTAPEGRLLNISTDMDEGWVGVSGKRRYQTK